MLDLNIILEEILNESSVNNNDIRDAIDNKYRVIINYNSHGENIAKGWRIIEVYAYGLTKAGNPVIRAYQPYGDTSSRIPSWKFFRIDRILTWKKTGQFFDRPRELYNYNGDNSMSVMYYNAKFNNDNTDNNQDKSNYSNSYNMANKYGPKMKNDAYKTDYEKQQLQKLQSLNKQLNNPIYFKDLKNLNKTNYTGPKLKNNRETLTNKNNDTIFNIDNKDSENLNNNDTLEQDNNNGYRKSE